MAAAPGIVPKRILLTSSDVHYSQGPHRRKVDYDNLQFEKGSWDHLAAYNLSKMAEVMICSGFYYHGLITEKTTMISFHPGVINTNMLNSIYPMYQELAVDLSQTDASMRLATQD